MTESQRRNLQQHITATRISTAASMCCNENKGLTLLAVRFIDELQHTVVNSFEF
jgi:hypothetical protein